MTALLITLGVVNTLAAIAGLRIYAGGFRKQPRCRCAQEPIGRTTSDDRGRW